MDITTKEIETYCQLHTTEENQLLQKLNRDTHLKILNPRMLSGHLQGRWLSMMSCMIQPERILEIGTFTGYSALCLAEGLTKDGMIYTIDVNEELENFANSYFEQSDYVNNIKFMIGDAAHIIPEINEVFDLVFIDADKKSYPTYYEMILPKVRKGGIILVDNVLWDGKVVEEAVLKDKKTKIIHEFNEFIQNDDRVENVLMPIRDGIMVIRKL